MLRAQTAMNLVVMAVLAQTAPVRGQCTTIDFEDLPVGTAVTTQYPGVTFSAEPNSCAPLFDVMPIIVDSLPGGTSSPHRALSVAQGCPEFSQDYLKMVFDDPVSHVGFTIGDRNGLPATLLVRTFHEDGSMLAEFTLNAIEGIKRYVSLGACNFPTYPPVIKIVEVEGPSDAWYPTIDDLSIGCVDSTPPTTWIEPLPGCHCGDTTLALMGYACDEDGAYGSDTLEYRNKGAAPGDPWIFIDSAGTPQCAAGGFLYFWDTTMVPHGWYYLRITSENACGVTTVAWTEVFIDRQFGTVAVASPGAGETVCGTVEIRGSINEGCGSCFDSYTVQYAPLAGGPFTDVDPLNPTYGSIVINGTLATWDTSGIADGDYLLRVVGSDDCGNTGTVDVAVTVQNSAGCGCPADANGNGDVDFGDILAIIAAWGPCPTP